MINKTELLAPAGNWEAFIAAVENGADAVYLGGKLFNARQFAGNFDNEQLEKALDYAHVRGVKIYLTLNTIIADDEIKSAQEFIGEAYRMGIDGIIVQDIGLARLIREIFPDLDLHASTQMTVYNLEGVNFLKKMGFKRVVLARELSIDEIKHITSNTALEIEVFIHGALCISYSGQCLMSSVIGGRSGNRGKCAQPCRLPYELLGRKTGDGDASDSISRFRPYGKGYLLSSKDLCTVEEMGKIVGAGVRSLKIEGRMKSPEYVAVVVGTYRKYLDLLQASGKGEGDHDVPVDHRDLGNLAQIFNRGGFSTGYFLGKLGKDMMSYEKPKNWGIYLGEVISHDKAAKTIKVKLAEELSLGDGIEVWNGEEGESPGNVVTLLRKGSRDVDAAGEGDIVTVGSISGRIYKGNKVYRTSSAKLNDAARETYTRPGRRRVLLWGRMSVRAGEPVWLAVGDEEGNQVEVRGDILPEPAINKPLTEERLIGQLLKTGGTPFDFEKPEIILEPGLSLPISEINNIRRKALEEMEKRRAGQYKRRLPDTAAEKKEKLLHFPESGQKKTKCPEVSVLFYDAGESWDYTQLDADRIYFPFRGFLEGRVDASTVKAIKEAGKEVFLWLPPITRGNYDRLIKAKLDDIEAIGVDGILAGNLGSLEYLRSSTKLILEGDYSFNAFNSYSLEELYKSGLKEITLSLEMSLAQIRKLKEIPGLSKNAVVYGRIPVMTSEYCPVGSIVGGFGKGQACNKACMKGEYRLKDRKGVEFPVLCDRIDCRATLLNSSVIFVPDSIDGLRDAGIDRIRLNITDEKAEEVYHLASLFRSAAKDGVKALKEYGEFIDEVKSKGFTKGHYYRGV